MNSLPHSQTTVPYRRGKRVWLIVAGLLLLAAGAAYVARGLRRQHGVIVRFRHAVEQAAAPGETIATDDRELALLLQRFGASAVKRPVTVIANGPVPAWMLESREEMIVVSAEDGALPAALRAKGFVLTEDVLWNESGVAGKLPVRGRVRIYFAAPAHVY